MARVLLADTKQENGVTEDAPTVWTALAGTEIDAGAVVVDARVFAVRTSRERFEDAGVQAASKAFWSYGAQGSLYINLVPRATLIISGGAVLAGDHEVSDVRDTDQEDYKNFFVQVGIHFFLGLDSKP
jgi:hypothetical protein